MADDELTPFDVIQTERDDRRGTGGLPLSERIANSIPGNPLRRELLTVSNAVVRLDFDHRARSALLQCFTANIRWTLDGTTPAAAVGFQQLAGDFVTLTGVATIRAWQAIREGANDATLEIVYFD